MPVFEIERDGKVFEIEAPDQNTAMNAFSAHNKSEPAKSWGQTIKENLIGDDDPTTQNFGEKVGSFLNKGGESLTLGTVGDETSAKIESMLGIGAPTTADLVSGDNRNAYERRRDHYRDQEDLLAETNPGASIAAEFAPLLIPGVGAAGAAGKGASLTNKIIRGMLASGAAGATYGATEAEGGAQERLKQGAITGAVSAPFGALAPLAGRGYQKLAQGRAEKRAIKQVTKSAPTTEELSEHARKLYEVIDQSGAEVAPSPFRAFVNDQIGDIASKDMRSTAARKLRPDAAAVIDQMMEMSKTNNPLKFADLQDARELASDVAGDFTRPKQQRVGVKMKGALDEFIEGLTDKDMASGDPKVLTETLPEARDAYARMARSQKVDDIVERAGYYTSGETSGIRNQLSTMLKNKKAMAGFSEQERKLMKRIVDGSLPEQALNMAGGRLAQMLATLGVTVSGGAASGAMTALAGQGARRLSDAMSTKNAEMLRAFVANGTRANVKAPSAKTQQAIEKLLRAGGPRLVGP